MHYKLITKNPFIQLVRFLTSFGIISSVILKWSVAARAKPAPQLTRTAFSAVIPNKTKWREESGSMRYKCIKNIF
ncbi:MAG TPA: hypothetical protein VK808_08865, partial [Bacteroidia bacterium]|nr:hypothetical protein [Bacteroidia bacterium]